MGLVRGGGGARESASGREGGGGRGGGGFSALFSCLSAALPALLINY